MQKIDSIFHRVSSLFANVPFHADYSRPTISAPKKVLRTLHHTEIHCCNIILVLFLKVISQHPIGFYPLRFVRLSRNIARYNNEAGRFLLPLLKPIH